MGQIKIGSELSALGRRFGGIDLKIERDQTPVKAADFDDLSPKHAPLATNPRRK